MSEIKLSVKDRFNTVLMVISIAGVSFFAYKDILQYFFTGLDSLNLIEEGRFNSFREFLGLFTRPMTQEFAWYRPLAEFSYGLDYAIWGLDPFGFQLMQVLLHVSVSVFVFFFVRFLLNGKDITAWVSAVIFALHPIHIEVIPVTARRNDMIITLFILPSLMLFIKYFMSGLSKKSYLFLSIFFYALALLTKELAVIVPVMIFSYAFIFSFKDKASFTGTFIYSLKRCIPYLALTVVYLLWRMYILSGMGGYTSSFAESGGILTLIVSLYNIPLSYFLDLFYPVDFLRLDLIFSPFTTILKQTIFTAALLVLLTLLFLYRKRVFGEMFYEKNRVMGNIKKLLFVVIILSLASLLIYPVISPLINRVIQQSYSGEGYVLLSKAMGNIGSYPVGAYFFKARDMILRPLLFSLFLSSACFALVHQRIKLRDSFIHSQQGKLTAFLVVWIFIPLSIYMVTSTFDHHDMYISVIPFTVILSILLSEGCRDLRSVKPVLMSAVAISLLWYSPLIKTYGEWEASGNISRDILEKLSDIIPELPDDAVLHIENFPGGIASYKKAIPHAREVGYYAEFTIKSWLDMKYPSNNMKVLITNKTELPHYPDNVELEIEYGADNNVMINIIYDLKEKI